MTVQLQIKTQKLAQVLVDIEKEQINIMDLK